ncbi:MAG: hypothetical protein PVJ15_06445 [Gammaproteobacteria bacterium]|jgi:hypothetical protein
MGKHRSSLVDNNNSKSPTKQAVPIRTAGVPRAAHLHPLICRKRVAAGLLALWAASAHSAYQDDIGYTQLLAETGGTLPDGSGVAVTQVEADTDSEPSIYSYLPDPDNSQFTGKDIVDRTGLAAGNYSGHATGVAKRFFGNSSSVAPGISVIDAYLADTWLFDDFLKGTNSFKPDYTSDRVANHSWIGSTTDPAVDADLLRRVDWLVERDEFIQAVGQKNNTSTNSPLLSGAFNVIAVGKSDGVNGRDAAQVDSTYTSGRTRPHVVVPVTSSSSATPVVAAAAALLVELGHNDAGLSTDPLETQTTNRAGDIIRNAERAQVIKAALMAGAERHTLNTSGIDISDYRADPANRSANGLDIRYGAGQLNIYNSYHIIAAGEQNSAEDGAAGAIASDGFDYDPSFGGSGGSNSVASYYFSTGAAPAVVSATLAWNLDIAGGNGQNFSGTTTLHDLNLLLYDVTGSALLLADSTATGDNTESLWFALQAGRDYRLQVVPVGTFDWDYALAWRIALDSDGDGVADTTDAFPLDPAEDTDTDHDGTGNNADADDDDDGLSDGEEAAIGTNPLLADTDSDGFPDRMEVITGHDPLNRNDTPVWGDLDDNGRIDTADVLLATRAILQLLTLNAKQFTLGDLAPKVNGQYTPDGEFNAADLLLIQREAMY